MPLLKLACALSTQVAVVWADALLRRVQTGNVGTEDILYMLQRMGFETGIDIDKVIETAKWLEGPLGAAMPAMVSRAGLFPPQAA